MRFTLSKLFVVVTILALASAGMTLRTVGWDAAIVTLSIALFVAAAIRAATVRGADRAFLVAFAAVGGFYLLMATSTIFHGLRELLVTNYPLAIAARELRIAPPARNYTAAPSLERPPTTPSALASYMSALNAAPTPAPINRSGDALQAYVWLGLSQDDEAMPIHRFFMIGHCVWSWFFAILAGWFAAVMYAKRQRQLQTTD